MRTQHAGHVPELVAERQPPLIVNNMEIATDHFGYLLDAEDWSRAVSQEMAQRDGVELGDDHWVLIDFLNRFYREYQVPPDLPVLSRNLCKDQRDCRWSRKYIKQLFPGGARMACRYAGLPMPVRSCL